MSQFDQAVFSKALIAIRTRAERLDGDQIVDSFSSVGPLADLISSHDHQVIYGRRGTGKTHALRFLYARVNQEGDIGIFVDMLKLGSNTSIYNDQSLTIPERATRLLIDTLAHIQEGFLDYATSGVAIDFQSLGKLLDGFNEATSQVRVSGEVTRTTETTELEGRAREAQAQLGATSANLLGRLGFSGKTHSESAERISTIVQGRELYSVRFPQLGAVMRDLTQFFAAPRVWIIIDEWSSGWIPARSATPPTDRHHPPFTKRSGFPNGTRTI